MDAWIETDVQVHQAVHAPSGASKREMCMIAGKWKTSSLLHLENQPMCCNDLAPISRGARKKNLSHRLSELDLKDHVSRHLLCPKPLPVPYATTPFGAEALDRLREGSEGSGS